MTAEEQGTIAHGIAAALGAGWVGNFRANPYYPGSGTTEIAHCDGRSMWLRWDKDRLNINGNWPKDRSGRESFPKDNRASISVSASRSVESIARDIQRRFLPDYDRQWAEQIASVAKWNSYEEQTEATAKALEALGARRSNHHGGGVGASIDLYFGQGSHLYKVSAQGESVRLEAFNVPVRAMAAIVKAAQKVKGED